MGQYVKNMTYTLKKKSQHIFFVTIQVCLMLIWQYVKKITL